MSDWTLEQYKREYKELQNENKRLFKLCAELQTTIKELANILDLKVSNDSTKIQQYIKQHVNKSGTSKCVKDVHIESKSLQNFLRYYEDNSI